MIIGKKIEYAILLTILLVISTRLHSPGLINLVMGIVGAIGVLFVAKYIGYKIDERLKNGSK